MNFQNFVTESIVQIVRGIEAASDTLKDSTAVVSPKNVRPTDTQREYLLAIENPTRKAHIRLLFNASTLMLLFTQRRAPRRKAV
jgi:hypothetical protein